MFRQTQARPTVTTSVTVQKNGGAIVLRLLTSTAIVASLIVSSSRIALADADDVIGGIVAGMIATSIADSAKAGDKGRTNHKPPCEVTSSE
jgi:uncharacterized YccA/Bax inhibitor family protein